MPRRPHAVRGLAGRRFVLAPYGSAGDVYPFLWLGKALQEAGASVVVVSSPVFQAAADHCRLRLIPVGTAEDFHRLARNPDFWHPIKGPWRVLMSSREWFEPLSEVLETFLRPSHAVLIASAPNFPATLAARKTRRPHLTVHLQPAVVFSAQATPLLGLGWGWFRRLPAWLKRRIFRFPSPVDWVLGPTLRRVCRRAGLPRPRSLMTEWWDSPEGVLCLFPEWFAPRQSDWPARLYQADFPLFDPIPPSTEQNPALEDFLAQGRAPLVFTAGSAMGCPGDFFSKAAAATAALKERAVFVTAYPDSLPPDLPSSILPLSYVPFHHLFPRASVVIHHGGIGTTAQSLAAGVPQLILPISHDQPDNAERVVRLGCGGTLPWNRRQLSNLTEALGELLSVSEYRLRAEHFAGRLPPPGQASNAAGVLQAIEDFIGEK